MRQIRLRSVFLMGALVGLGGCVSGAIDGETPSGAGNSGSGSGFGATSSSSGATSGGGTTGGGGTSAANMTMGGNAAGNISTGGTTPTGGSPGGGNPGGGNPGGGNPSGGVSSGGNAGSGGAGGSVSAPKDCKRGVAFPSDTLTNAEAAAGLTWWYNWGIGIKAVGAGLEFTPMISGGGTQAANDEKAIRSDAKYLLGYNEPNFNSQANLPAAQAAADWPTLEAVAKAKNLKLVSPAVNYCGDDSTKTGPCNDTNPVHYLQTFFAACTNCQVDYVAVHWYNCDGASLKSYLDMFKQFNRPIWLTEFACAFGGDTSLAGQQKYMDEAIPILEGRSDVFRYAWFSGDPIPNAKLLNSDGSPTDLGKHYMGLPHDPSCAP